MSEFAANADGRQMSGGDIFAVKLCAVKAAVNGPFPEGQICVGKVHNNGAPGITGAQ